MRNGRWNFLYCALALGLLATATAQAGSFTVNVVDPAGSPVSGFRWLLQEDTTYHPVPGVGGDPDILSFNFHKSYNPPAADAANGAGLQGNTDNPSTGIINNVLDGNYYLSVLPFEGYSISGAPVVIDSGGPKTVTVTVQKHPIPTAQITIYLFHDNYPINGAPNLPEESNPAPGQPGHVDWTEFSLFLEEPGGMYGIAGGQVIQDAFGNPLGTSYQKGCDANGDSDTNPTTNFGCFDASGAPIIVTEGDGTIHPNPDGTITVENLVPAKYGIVIIPPTGSNWQQTSTIEGSKVIDAWVKAREPAMFVEFGPPGPHVFVGFLKSTANDGFDPLPGPGATVSGTIKDIHLSRAPSGEFFNGRSFPSCWVGLNNQVAGGQGVYAAPCDEDSGFSIPNVAPGNYQLVVFDSNMDIIINLLAFTVDENGDCDGGVTPGCNFEDVGVFSWFTRINAGVFNDDDQDGFWDDNEAGIGPESQDVGLRWRDGTIFQNFPTDNEGFAPFDEVFPFFHWLVAEVSFGNKKATGVTYVIDAGGSVDTNVDTFPGFGQLTPQAQCQPVDPVNDPDGPTVAYDPATGTCPPGTEAININTNSNNNLSRTEVGPSLTTGFQGFQGQTNVMQFGKTDYVGFDFSTPMPTFVGENGGISGIIYYAITRAENEPQFAAAEEWEPGVPRVQVNLYADGDIDSFPLGDFPDGFGDIDWDNDGVLDGDDNIIDDVNLNGIVGELADVDNYPLGWADGSSNRGPEDIDRDDPDQTLVGDAAAVFDFGDAVQVTWTDSWDDSLPTGCQGETFYKFGNPQLPTDCYDGLRNWNQIRPAVFDGGYAFVDYDLSRLPPITAAKINAFYDRLENGVENDPMMPPVANFEKLQLGLLPGDYIVESATPSGYEQVKEEDRNVDYGDEYIPSPEALPPVCVGDDRVIPQYFSFLTKDGSGNEAQLIDTTNIGDAGAFAPYFGQTRPLCDRKKVPLSSGQNAAAEFFLMTDVPVMANISGTMLNDLANAFDPDAPSFGEKFAPPWLPVAFYDWNGAEINRVYTDQYGRFSAVVASTFTANVGMPSGMSPNMLQSCMNDAGAVPDGAGGFQLDPNYDPAYSQFCYTFQYMPGNTTYLDTPVVSISAFANVFEFPLDCEMPTQTPVISTVTRGGGGPFALVNQQISIHSMGLTDVPNPEWNGTDAGSRIITRDYSFSCGGLANAELEAANGTRTALGSLSCSAAQIDGIVPAGLLPGDYQVVVSGSDGTESPIGVTLTVGTAEGVGQRPNGQPYAVRTVSAGGSIQDAIDEAAAGDLILVAPGSYDEMLVMWKPVKLQGWGAGDVFINARPVPTEKLTTWRELTNALVTAGSVSQLPGQEAGLPGFPLLNTGSFPTEEGAGILVLGIDDPNDPRAFDYTTVNGKHNANARIDGFTILGSNNGGGIVVNGYAQNLVIGNVRLTGNAGIYGGGIRVGHPALSHQIEDANDPAYSPADGRNIGDVVYDDATNDRIRIHHNQVIKNGGQGGAGGGISLHTGTDDYKVQNNWVCGNFTQGDGAGIGHLGLSDNGLIEDNVVAFNESFSQGNDVDGGGIFIGGQPDLMPDNTVVPPLALTPGSGSVVVDANLLRGNLAGAGDGGGISIRMVNGEDVNQSLDDTGPWYAISLYNNGITNNVAALAGGGIVLRDALKVDIRNNTVANNDSAATSGLAFAPGSTNESTPHPAGIVSRVHSSSLASVMAGVSGTVPGDWKVFSDPDLQNTIVYNNRSFYWLNFDDPGTPGFEVGLFPASCSDPVNNPGATGCDVNNVNLFSNDLAVLDGRVETANLLNPMTSLLTNTSGYDPSNIQGDPAFVNPVFNEDAGLTLTMPENNAPGTGAAFDEGGNFIQLRYGPLSLLQPGAAATPAENTTWINYHLGTPSVALNTGGTVPASPHRLSQDFDNDSRPIGPPDIGADEAGGPGPLADSDGDGVSDDVDNCTETPNADQRDTDGDKYGNACDADLNNDGNVNIADLTLFKSVFPSKAQGREPYTLSDHADFTGDGAVNVGDLTTFKAAFPGTPGPSCCAP